MDSVYLALGSNLGDRAALLNQAVSAIARMPDTVLAAESPIYETPPMGPQDQGAYLNMAVAIHTSLEPHTLMDYLQLIEHNLGRPAPELREHWGPRPIDIDILLFGGRLIESNDLRVPHPGMAERWFVLKPLADLAPRLLHPTLGRTITQLLAEVPAPDQATEYEMSR